MDPVSALRDLPDEVVHLVLAGAVIVLSLACFLHAVFHHRGPR